LTSKKTITGEDEDEESELEFLTEIRDVRDKHPDLFARIKRLPRKARSTRIVTESEVCLSPRRASAQDREAYAALLRARPSGTWEAMPPMISIPSTASVRAAQPSAQKALPALLTYFRQGRLDKFYLAQSAAAEPAELDFIQTVKVLRPADTEEKRQAIPDGFYGFLDKNKQAFAKATSPEADDAVAKHKGGANDAYVLKRLKAKEIRRYHGFTEDDELFIRQVLQLLADGALPRPTTKKVAEALKTEAEPLKVLGILRRDIPSQFFRPTRAQATHHTLSPREVILSSYLLEAK